MACVLIELKGIATKEVIEPDPEFPCSDFNYRVSVKSEGKHRRWCGVSMALATIVGNGVWKSLDL